MQFIFDTDDDKTGRFSCLKQQLVDFFPDLPAIERNRFVMIAPYARMILANQKITTIRFTPAAVEFPARATLPLFIVEDAERHSEAKQYGTLQILGVRYKTVCDLDDDDARNDGFGSRAELMDALQQFYADMMPSDFVCIYSLRPAMAASAINGKSTKKLNKRRSGRLSSQSRLQAAV
jgi:hypothetical protein